MNKQRVTQKFIKGRYNNIIVVPYCGLRHLLTFTPCPYYTTRTEGWGSDIYELDYNSDLENDSIMCDDCGFDIKMYIEAYERIYNEKLRRLDNKNKQANQQVNVQVASVVNNPAQATHKPRCPYCNSENLTRITSFDKAVNIAMFGLLGNKRRYQYSSVL